MRKSCIALLSTVLLMPLLAEAQLAHLTVTVRGLKPATGTLEVSVFNSAESFLKKPVVQRSKKVDGKAELAVKFAGLSNGDYAVVVVHDANGNGVLDTGFLGFGGEHYGYSNDASSWWGRPSFNQARFTIGTEDKDIVINLD
jgi:uncharacterized protein (DUF2141 family)